MRSSTIPSFRLIGAAVALGLAGLVLTTVHSRAVAAEPPQQIEGGLVRVDKAKADHVYLLPGANFAKYKRVRMDPVDVSFSPQWKPNDTRSSLSQKLTADDVERIRKTVAEEFDKVFSEELRDGGYSLVNEDGPDVLRVTPKIVNLYINAPDKQSSARTRTYVTSAGHLTLQVVLRDAATGQYLAAAVDSVSDNTSGMRFEVANSVTNLGFARTAFSRWAQALLKGIEDAKQASLNSPSRLAGSEGAGPR
jgi:Protein of unknown function (DUF3313)